MRQDLHFRVKTVSECCCRSWFALLLTWHRCLCELAIQFSHHLFTPSLNQRRALPSFASFACAEVVLLSEFASCILLSRESMAVGPEHVGSAEERPWHHPPARLF